MNPPPKGADPATFPCVPPAFARPRANPARLTATWIGHATVLVQIGGLNVLTDPVWSRRASPVSFAGPARVVPAAVPFAELPSVDVVLLSHNHYDHLDARTVRRLATVHRHAQWLVPLGLADFVRRRGVERVTELDWWDETRVGEATVACAPAQHFSARGLSDRMRTLWCGWTVEARGRRVYFAGDTAYCPVFAEIARRRGPFDLVILPIGAYEPRWFMRSVHMNPEDALRAYRDLSDVATTSQDAGPTPTMLAVHWGTFRLTDEPLAEPPARMCRLWAEAGCRAEALWVPKHGETRDIVAY